MVLWYSWVVGVGYVIQDLITNQVLRVVESEADAKKYCKENSNETKHK